MSFDGSGGVLAFWQELRIESDSPEQNSLEAIRLLVSTRAAGGNWAAPTVLSDWKRDRVTSAYAGNDRGEEVVVDSRSPTTVSPSGVPLPSDGVFAWRRSSTGSWSGPTQVANEQIPHAPGRPLPVRAALNDAGVAVVTWQPVVVIPELG